MKIRPLYDRVIVERQEADEMTKSGLYIPDTAKEKPIQGRVLAVGNGKRNEKGESFALEVKEGDKVLFGKYSGTEIKFEGAERIILREDEILAIIEN
jgi:chaperonin GroES